MKCNWEYKGYTAELDIDYPVIPYCGHIANINDLVTFEASTLDDLEKQFRLAVDDYIEFCKEVGKNRDGMK